MTPDKTREMTGYVRESRAGGREGAPYASPVDGNAMLGVMKVIT